MDLLSLNFLGSLNIGGGLMALVILIAWISIVYAITGLLARIAITCAAAGLLLWALGVAPTVVDVLFGIAEDAWMALVAVWRWIVGLFL